MKKFLFAPKFNWLHCYANVLFGMAIAYAMTEPDWTHASIIGAFGLGAYMAGLFWQVDP